MNNRTREAIEGIQKILECPPLPKVAKKKQSNRSYLQHRKGKAFGLFGRKKK